MLYAALHFFVDLVCAWSMFSFFVEGNYGNLLIYNFCAFALQMPLGTLLDVIAGKKCSLGCWFAAAGVALTVLGSTLNPALLGIGNALFHVGGGFNVIREDLAHHREGRTLGIFVAPGAVGLYIGTVLAKAGAGKWTLVAAAAVMAVLLILAAKGGRKDVNYDHFCQGSSRFPAVLMFCCFVVVVLRSWVGLGVSFAWKSSGLYAALAVCGAAAGKGYGGFLGARFGVPRTAALTLLLAAACYLMADIPAFGIAAVFLFNMSMPLTLWLLAKRLPRLAGFSFGLLTFGLFLGFLPVYAQVQLPVSGTVLGALGSVISCILLMIGGKAGKYDEISI